jgi:molecular chaperone Hsp33
MNDKDIIHRFLFEDIPVRGEWVRLTDSYRTIVLQHQYPVLIQRLIGEMLVVATLLSAIVKFKGGLSVQFQGKNKLKLLLSQCDQEFNVRALAQWLEEIQPEELDSVFKDGVIGITIEPQTGAQRYQGLVAWQGHSISESIEGYFRDSEQLPTRLWIEVTENNATGLLLQVLPKDGSKPQAGDDDWDRLLHVTDTVKPEELSQLDPVTLLRRLYAEDEVRIFQANPVKFGCKCSTERCENAIRILGKEEAESELKAKQVIIVTCEFCSKEYSFDRVDIARIFSQGENPPSSTQVH